MVVVVVRTIQVVVAVGIVFLLATHLQRLVHRLFLVLSVVVVQQVMVVVVLAQPQQVVAQR
jgi:hypothetical protein